MVKMELDHSDEEQIIKLAVDYLENRLDSKTVKWYETHVIDCKTCNKTVIQEAENDLFHELTAPNMEGHITIENILNYVVAEKMKSPEKLNKEVTQHIKDCKMCCEVYNILTKVPYSRLKVVAENKKTS